ncbi:hypothetical protein GCM10023325_08080 [Sphingomonas lutea]
MRMIGAGVALLALAACGSGGDAGNSAKGANVVVAAGKAIDPCSLVTAGEVGAIVGDTIVAAKPAEGRCNYETADAAASTVTIEVDHKDAANHMKVERDTARVLGKMGGAVAGEGAAGADVDAMLKDSASAPGIGDEALFDINARLSVRKGDVYLAVEPPMMRSRMSSGSPLLSSEDKRKMALAIAQKALARLP